MIRNSARPDLQPVQAGFSSNTLTKLRRDEIVALPVLDKICDLLDADYGDIMEHVKTTKEQE